MEKGTRLISGRYLVVYALLESPLQGSGWLGVTIPTSILNSCIIKIPSHS